MLTYEQRKEQWTRAWYQRTGQPEPNTLSQDYWRLQISELRDELTSAHALAEAQRARIEFLEGLVARLQVAPAHRLIVEASPVIEIQLGASS